MKTFVCHCGNTLHFENSQCLACGRTLGFLPDHGVLSALEPASSGQWRALHPAAANGVYHMCNNYIKENVCNWMVPNSDPARFCSACRLNGVIPDLSIMQNRILWHRIERAKRRLFFTLNRLGLPVVSRQEDKDRGLSFEFLADQDNSSEFFDDVDNKQRVMTGHRTGVITINIAEADPIQREEIRKKMSERYRTLLGHFRHEIGHYFWDRLVRNTEWLEGFRVLFGDERVNYDESLQAYYNNGPPADWQQSYISAYASSHPWEDWGESWAHYLHIFDTIETANDFGFAIEGQELASPPEVKHKAEQFASSPYANIASFDNLLLDWGRLTIAMNALNRSMGQRDAYPFVLSPKVAEKLRFVHTVIVSNAK